jgi:hypothetical protein
MLIKISRIGESNGLYDPAWASLSFNLDFPVFVFRIAPTIYTSDAYYNSVNLDVISYSIGYYEIEMLQMLINPQLSQTQHTFLMKSNFKCYHVYTML